MNLDHLHALQTRLSRERARLDGSAGDKLRRVWIVQIEREITEERLFLGLPAGEPSAPMSDDELFDFLNKVD